MNKRTIIITRGCPYGRMAEGARARFNSRVPPRRRIGIIVANNAPFDPLIQKLRGEKEIAMCPTAMIDGMRVDGLDGEDDYLLFLRTYDATSEWLNDELGGMR